MSSCIAAIHSITSTKIKKIDQTEHSPPITKKKVSFLNTYKIIECRPPKERKSLIKSNRNLNLFPKANSQYLTTGNKRQQHKKHENGTKRPPPFWRPSYRQQEAFRIFIKTQDKLDHRTNKEIKYFQRNNYRSRQSVGIRNRIFVPHTTEFIKTILGLDPSFYSLVEGRPIQYKQNRNEYINDTIKCSKFRLQAGYINDEMLLMEFDQAREEKILKKVDYAIDEYSEAFEKFLANDYQMAKKIMDNSKKMGDDLRKKNEEHKQLTEELVSSENKAVELGEKCSRFKSYQKFIYQLSPYSWCDENGIKTSLQKSTSEFYLEELCSISDNSELKTSRSIVMLEKLKISFHKYFENIPEPKMYFKYPWQMVSIIKTIVLMNFRSWSNSEKLAESLNQVKIETRNLEKRLVKEFDDIQNIVVDLTIKIEEEEKKANNKKEKAMKLIREAFYNTVASDEVLKLKICVQDVYERLNFPNVNFSTFDMMKILELEYESCMRELDDISLDCVKQAQKQSYAEDKRMLKTAEEASKHLNKLRLLREMHNKAFSCVSKNLNKFELLFLHRKKL